MKQLLILSGKGGTGKTTLAGAFIKFANARAMADCDVDAPNLHLVTEFESKPQKSDFYGLPVAYIDPDICTACDLCRKACRFDAIKAGNFYEVDEYACEGCGVCAYVCPFKAIEMKDIPAGELMLWDEVDRVFSTAKLKMGRGTSGLLVTRVKNSMKAASEADFAIIDGSPGIGCPVIASLTGVDMVLIVAEPSLSGISDMDRIINTAAAFALPCLVCVNKYDTNPEISEKIEDYCKEKGLNFVGRIPYDNMALEAINQGKTIADVDCPAGRAAKEVFDKTMNLLFPEEDGYENKSSE
ncbi:MAG TPA: ATP-binding protein [Clostridiales bacterium]|jgi:MinD superfamily P-loop ATPase|nr:ATP-binding protein [Clostridiales bacterium]HRT82453.1 ATP-binding protein [Oscillospiraceae bacterium]